MRRGGGGARAISSRFQSASRRFSRAGRRPPHCPGLVAYVDLDERAIDAFREFNEEGALSVLQQFKESDLSHVQNKSAFLCGVMKTYRQREKQGSKVQESTKGSDEAKIKALLERTGYTLDVTTGQRKYGGPPPDSVYSGVQPGIGTELKKLKLVD
ncbi:Heterogeneous nuclear ribonucleoprotein R [Sciurus carolinensis]|uniref:Heterogeneous nuclear ribonucleoprotein R n=1 Tax=Sciurus carolinensis TaxID=30640 RepID=A0AA41MDJ9_SCICA|nr:Heterogeneous nuclear ribonucleoprotein R [Sciurus carolinensis]